MARGAVWSRSLSLRHTKIMLINPENLRVDQHLFIGAWHVINMCSTARHVFAVRFTRDLHPTASVWRRDGVALARRESSDTRTDRIYFQVLAECPQPP